MICIGKKNDGNPCKAQAEKGFLTCLRHRDQEPGIGQETKPIQPTKTVNVAKEQHPAELNYGTVTFGSAGDRYSFVIPEVTKKIDGKKEVVQEKQRIRFVGGFYKTDEPEAIEYLRKYIEEHPEVRRFLFEL